MQSRLLKRMILLVFLVSICWFGLVLLEEESGASGWFKTAPGAIDFGLAGPVEERAWDASLAHLDQQLEAAGYPLRPLLFRDSPAAKQWPALSKWSAEFLRDQPAYGRLSLPFARAPDDGMFLYSSHTKSLAKSPLLNWSRGFGLTRLTVSEFIDRTVVSASAAAAMPVEPPPPSTSNAATIPTTNNNDDDEDDDDLFVDEVPIPLDRKIVPKFYHSGPLTDHDVLLADTEPRAPCFRFRNQSLHVNENVWLSGHGIVNLAHYDGPHNLFVQVTGRKRWLIVPHGAATNTLQLLPYVHPSGRHSGLAHTDALRRMLATGAAQIALLEPGDTLYLPPMYWHAVEVLDEFSVSVNMWTAAPESVVDAVVFKMPLPFEADWTNVQMVRASFDYLNLLVHRLQPLLLPSGDNEACDSDTPLGGDVEDDGDAVLLLLLLRELVDQRWDPLFLHIDSSDLVEPFSCAATVGAATPWLDNDGLWANFHRKADAVGAAFETIVDPTQNAAAVDAESRQEILSHMRTLLLDYIEQVVLFSCSDVDWVFPALHCLLTLKENLS